MILDALFWLVQFLGAVVAILALGIMLVLFFFFVGENVYGFAKEYNRIKKEEQENT